MNDRGSELAVACHHARPRLARVASVDTVFNNDGYLLQSGDPA